MKEKLIKLLEIQDSSKSPFQFLFKGKRNIYFPFGMFLSLLINISTICLSTILLLELIYHIKPNVSFAKFQSQITKNMTLNTKELIFTIAFRDKYHNLIVDPSIAFIQANYLKTISTNGIINSYVFNLTSMNCSNIYPIFKNYGLDDRFNSTGILYYNCYNYTEPIIIGGKYGTDFYGNIEFHIKKCRNSSNSNIICKSEEEINSILQKGWLEMTYISSFIDFNNFSNPIQHITEDTYFNIDINLNKQLYIYFSSLEIYSENNIIFSNRKNESSTKKDFSEKDILTVKDDGEISLIIICPSFNIDKYYRSYAKIQEIGASISSFYSGLNLICFILSLYHKFRYTEMKIINDLFIFGCDKILNQKDNLFKLKKLKNLSVNKINNINYIYQSSLILSRQVKIESKIIKGSKIYEPSSVSIPFYYNNIQKLNKLHYYKIDLKFINTLKLLFCSWRRKSNINFNDYKYIMKELLKYIDFIEVSKLLMDIEKIKGILECQDNEIKWKTGKKLFMLYSEEKKKTKEKTNNIIESSMGNSNFFFGGRFNKTNDLLNILKK